MRRKRLISLLILTGIICMIMCSPTGLAEERNAAETGLKIIAKLPDGVHFLRLPKGMVFQAPSGDETDLKAIWLMEPEMEIEFFSYEAADAELQSLAEQLTAAGRTAEIREIAGTDFLVFQDRDEADGAACIGYAYLWKGRMIEISFFYASQYAMDLTKAIMESFQ